MEEQPQADVALTAAGGSPLGSLRSRREEVVASQWDDRQVPRWNNPTLYVRYKPVDHSIIDASADKVKAAIKASKGTKASKTRGTKATAVVDANIDVLNAGVVGVYAKFADGNFYTLVDVDSWAPLDVDEETKIPAEGVELVGFEADLGQTLQEGEFTTARSVVRALYLEDGDILSTANWLSEFSGYVRADADDDFLGE